MSPRRPLPDREETERSSAARKPARAAFAVAALLLLILIDLVLWVRFG